MVLNWAQTTEATNLKFHNKVETNISVFHAGNDATIYFWSAKINHNKLSMQTVQVGAKLTRCKVQDDLWH